MRGPQAASEVEHRVTVHREREAILRCRDGDLAGLEVLFELHRIRVLRTAYGIVGRHHLAEDVTQQVFVELFTAIRRFDPERPFAPWLYRIVVNTSLKELRRRHHRSLPLDEAAADLPSLDPLPDLDRRGIGGKEIDMDSDPSAQSQAEGGRRSAVLPRVQRGGDGRRARLPSWDGEVSSPLGSPPTRSLVAREKDT